jgi:serine/threonine protein kinase
VINEEDAFKTEIGTPSYLAPEVTSVDLDQYTNAVDMWSFGCVIYWVLTRTIPFSRNDPTVLNNFIRDESFFPSQRLRDRGVSNGAIGFLRQLIVVQPSARTSSAMALGHPWLRGVDTAGSPARTKGHANVRYVPLSELEIALLKLFCEGRGIF